MELAHRIGVDENGLGARLGPLVVTAVLARADDAGQRLLRRRLPKKIRADLDDSKRLVSHGDVRLGEAWARALAPRATTDPADLLDAILLEREEVLSRPCPRHVRDQCWGRSGERFEADPELVSRVQGHCEELARRGLTLLAVRSAVVCTKSLNEQRERGINRFVADLHAMERLILALRADAGENVHATCGKVGGMGDYSRFFGPLSGHLHTVLAQGAERSGYYFPRLGEIHFVRDADARDPLVMLASLVGKYIRELTMARIARFYPSDDAETAPPSGYHDPVSQRFVERTALIRERRRVPVTCFERAREPDQPARVEISIA